MENYYKLDDLNKLLCTFTQFNEIDETVKFITSKHKILHNKMFVLKSLNTPEFIITYNIDHEGKEPGMILEDTILVHRKKESNTLYTINALNALIREINNGVLDTNYRVEWKNHSNCILLTNQDLLKKIETKLFRIISLN